MIEAEIWRVKARSWLRGTELSARTTLKKTASLPFPSVPSIGVRLTTCGGSKIRETAAKNTDCCAMALAMYTSPLSRVPAVHASWPWVIR